MTTEPTSAPQEAADIAAAARAVDTLHGVSRFRDIEAFRTSAVESTWLLRESAEWMLARLHAGARALPGYCVCCGRPSTFEFAPPAGSGQDLPNWREQLECTGCRLIARWRLCLGELLRHDPAPRRTSIYLTEQATRLFVWLQRRFARTTGSEYVHDEALRGPLNQYLNHLLGTRDRHVRHEDVTALTFPDSTFDFVLSFDVLEHVPDHLLALREFARVLRPGGTLILSVPLVVSLERTQLRARHRDDGTLEHLLPEEYHGDPTSAQGILCYRNFGWDLLDEIRANGFRDAVLLEGWSPAFAVLGTCNAIVATR